MATITGIMDPKKIKYVAVFIFSSSVFQGLMGPNDMILAAIHTVLNNNMCLFCASIIGIP